MDEIRRRVAPKWLAGPVAATVTIVVLWFVSRGFFVSFAGMAIAGAIAIGIGSGVAAAVEPDRAERNAAIVAYYVLVLAAAYLLILPALSRPTTPGMRGGPAVYPPSQPSGGPGVYPPPPQRF